MFYFGSQHFAPLSCVLGLTMLCVGLTTQFLLTQQTVDKLYTRQSQFKVFRVFFYDVMKIKT